MLVINALYAVAQSHWALGSLQRSCLLQVNGRAPKIYLGKTPSIAESVGISTQPGKGRGISRRAGNHDQWHGYLGLGRM